MEENRGSEQGGFEAAALEVHRKKNKKMLLLIILAVVVVLAAMSPLLYAMAHRAYLRSNPDRYFLDTLLKEDFKSGSTTELSVDFHIPEMEPYREIVRNMKLVFSASPANTAAEGNEMITSGTYGLVYKDRSIAEMFIAVSRECMRLDFMGEGVVLENYPPMPLGFDQNAEFKKLLEDKEIKEVLLELFAAAELSQKGVKEASTGEVCDVIKIRFTLKSLYDAMSSIVRLLDTNETLRNLIIDSTLASLDAAAEQAEGYEKDELLTMRSIIASGAFIDELQSQFAQMDSVIAMFASFVKFYIDSEFHVNDRGIIRTESKVSFEMPDFMTGESTAFTLNWNNFRNTLKTEGEVDRAGAGVTVDVLHPEQSAIQLQMLMDRVMQKIKDSPAMAEFKADLESVVGPLDGFLDF